MAAAGPSLASQARALIGERAAAAAVPGRRTAARASRSPGCGQRHVSPASIVGRTAPQRLPATPAHASRPRAECRSPRHSSPSPAACQDRGAQRSPRRSSPLPTPRRAARVSAPAASVACQSPASPCKTRKQSSDSACLERDTFETPDSPRTITESALQKSQLLLDKLLSMDLSEADIDGDGTAGAEVEAQATTEPPSAWAWPTQPAGATAEVPVEFLNMLAEMWGHLKEEKQRQTVPLAHPPLEICVPNTCAADFAADKLGGPPSLSSPGSTRLLTGSSSPASSIESPGGSSVMSQGDKAQLIRELREVLHASLAPKVTTLSPVISFRNPISARPSMPRAALSPRYRPAAASPPRSNRTRAAVTQSPHPVRAVFAQPRRVVLQPVAVANVHHIIAAC